MSKKLTLDEFISKSNIVHGNKYNYTQSVYINNSTKLRVICPAHGAFEIRAQGHMSGKGCMSCAIELRRKLKQLNTSEFIRRSTIKHGNKYDYSESEYTKAKDKIRIICRKHGVFYQTAHAHMSGLRCKLCSAERVTEKEFIERSSRIHNNKYSYSDSGFSLTSNSVNITCPTHGRFKMNANSHLKGHGCKECSSHNLGWRKSTYVDFCNKNYKGLSCLYVVKMESDEHSFFKVGISVHGYAGRYKFQRQRYRISKILEIQGDCSKIWSLEKELMRKFKKYRINFKTNLVGGNTECFTFVDASIINDTIDKYFNGECIWR